VYRLILIVWGRGEGRNSVALRSFFSTVAVLTVGSSSLGS
jgi:hypothetical protein